MKVSDFFKALYIEVRAFVLTFGAFFIGVLIVTWIFKMAGV